MQTVSCPSCGAEVTFRSHASVMAVCEYCGTGVLKDADAVKDLGKMSSVLEDYSRIQIGTSGVAGGRAFNVVGRIQLRYAAGMWNEWYVLFDDGSASWLGDSSGLYTLTTQRPADFPLPPFEQLTPGMGYGFGGAPFTVSEVRSAECIGGQGELPFKVGAGYRTRVADFRRGAEFLTLDYSDGPVPVLFSGVAVTLEGLQCQLLRDDDAIARSAGKYRGRLDALDCPSCGSPIKYLPGMTASLICPACHAQVDAASPKAQVLAAGERIAAVPTTLQLGAQAKLNNQEYTVIGMMRRRDDEGTEWDEYLLYGSQSGFSWLVETDEGWSRAEVMPEWPSWQGMGSPVVAAQQSPFNKLYEYGSVVTFAVGAFNWRVGVGDRTHVAEYGRGQVKLAAESTAEELTWSRSTPVPFDQMKAWFGTQFSGTAPAGAAVMAGGAGRYKKTAKIFIIIMLVVNAIPLLVGFSRVWPFALIGALAIYLPAMFMDSNDNNPP